MKKFTIVILLMCTIMGSTALAQAGGGFIPSFDFVKTAETPQEVATTLEIIVLLTILTLAPSILLMTTCFLRIAIVLSFVRRAIATQETPPNQVIMGMALILTFMVMMPTWKDLNATALQPYLRGEFENSGGQFKMLEKAEIPVREFMFKHTRKADVRLFVQITNYEGDIKSKEDVPTVILVPAFMISELKRAFIMGFLLFLPFLVVDMVVASILLAMGMMMLPPVMVSLPFKILLFILVDGWNLVIGSLVKSFF